MTPTLMRLRGATRETSERRPRLGQWARRRARSVSGERGRGAAVFGVRHPVAVRGLSGHLLGLDYAGAQAAARFMALKHSPDLFDKLRFMEAEARRLVNSDA